MKLEVGKYYRTYGGWKALIIWKSWTVYYVIHKPKEKDEKYVINHTKEGKAVSQVSIGEPPLYGKHHPADLKEEWRKS